MKFYDLYGYRSSADIQTARHAAESAVKCLFEAHDSSYHCGEYYRFGVSGSEHFILQRNFDESEEEWTEESHREFPLLLYVNESDDGEARMNSLVSAGFTLLRREKL